MLGLNQRKLQKLKRNPKSFFKDAIEKKSFWLNNTYKKYLPKKHKAFTQYTIISAVYNVEKYLDDYFKSIINQRLDFERNIFMILVDDGSTDNSAQIIKTYQEKYPKNIVYLYKENGGQASARNLGLKYMQENDYQTPWVTFTDPDDFLDRNYFYEVDKFLEKNFDQKLACIVCSINTFSVKGFYKRHPARFYTKASIPIRFNDVDLDIITTSTRSFFLFNEIKKISLVFDESIKTFEDCNFYLMYIKHNMNSSKKIAYLQNSVYYARKREDSTMKNITFIDYINSLYIIKIILNKDFAEMSYIPKIVQNLILFHLFFLIKNIVDRQNILPKGVKSEEELLNLLDEIFDKIEVNTIIKSLIKGFDFHYKIGICYCFKNEYPIYNRSYIEDIDFVKRQVLLRYFTPDDKDVESIRIDGREVYADCEKIMQYDFLSRVFIYEKRLWFHIPRNSKKLEFFIRGQKIKIYFKNSSHAILNIADIFNEFEADYFSSWLFIDKDISADDNAEHFYRYVKQNYPHQKIFFSLRRDSRDWDRLKKERFNLIEFGSREFEEVFKESKKIISSHIDSYLLEYFGKKTMNGKNFIFLQHGVTKDDISSWLNSKKINLFITSTQKEYESITGNCNHYKFGKKEVVLTGFARHDTLLENNDSQNKQILIMPTWRKNLVGFIVNSAQRELKKGFSQSEYFCQWNKLLNSSNLEKLIQEYGYKILFNPHPNIMPYLKDFKIPSFVSIASKNESLQDLFRKSSLMITDYSSVAFEMAYLKKPVLYYQFDENEFFNVHSYNKGYFNYRVDGFGPVLTTEESLLGELKNLLQNNCKVEEPYKSNIENTFAFKDGKCCERIYQEILKLDKPYQNEITFDYIKQKVQDALRHECYLEVLWRFQYILENFENFDEHIAISCIEVAMRLEKDYEIVRILLEKDYRKMSRDLKFAIIKNILSNKKIPKKELKQSLEI